jgi:cell division protein FtsW (lipid II flippase)
LGLYAALHAMVCTRLIPTTGLPMPFLSYGGSNLTFSMIALGLLLNLSRRQTESGSAGEDTGSPEARTVTSTVRRPAWA